MVSPNMPGKPTRPDSEAQIVALREVGYSVPAIAEHTGASQSTIKRILKRHGARKGALTAEAMEGARRELHGALTDDATKREVARAVLDDLALSRQIREQVAERLGQLSSLPPASDPKETGAIMRALAAAATVLKLSSDVQRLTLTQRNDHSAGGEDLPELQIKELTAAEIVELRDKPPAQDLLLSAPEPDADDDIVVEGEPSVA